MKEMPILFSSAMIRAILSGAKTQTRRIAKFDRAVGDPDVPPGHVLDLIYPGSLQYYGYVTPANDRPTWRVQRLCDATCKHIDDVGPYDGRHLKSWGPMPYARGDQLWVRETWGLHAHGDETDWFRGSVRGVPADSLQAQFHLALRADWGPLQDGCFWRPAIFMPRWASRITLEIGEVRVQRLQEISEDDARAEGVHRNDAAVVYQHGASGFDKELSWTARGAFAVLWDSINGKRAPWSSNPWCWAITFRRVL